MQRRRNPNHSALPNKKILEEEVKDETFSKFLSAEPYDRKNVKKSSKLLMNRTKFKYKNQFRIFESTDDFVSNFDIFDDERPVFVILAKSTNLWVVFCLVWEDSERATVFYKDSSGASVPTEVENKLRRLILQVKFVVHHDQDQEDDDESSYGPLCLRNLEILLQRFGENPQRFETDFSKIPFCTLADLRKQKLVAVINLTHELSKNVKFKLCLKKFLNKLPVQLAASVADLHKILEEELQKNEEDVDIKRIEEAKKQCLQEAEISKLSEDFKIEMNKERGEYELEMAKQFPTEMKRLRQIFLVLHTGERDEKFQEVLETIQKRLDIDYEQIKSFNQYVVEKDDVVKQENLLRPDDINDIVNDLAENDNDQEENIYQDCTPIEEIWPQVIFDMKDKDSLHQKNRLKLLQDNFYKVETYRERWKDADLRTINEWAKERKGNLDTLCDTVCESIAIMDRALYLLKGRRLRLTQILSVLIFCDHKDQGQLCQIQTGEGKTLVVSLLAVIKALQGLKVDVITSNPVLADEAVNDNKSFYSTFNLTVASNNVRQSKNCYTADVLYGSISNFQFDYLTDTFEGTNIRSGRPFEQVILDEVDSMLIDNGGHIAKLASPFPGMESLKYVYIKIWQELHKAENSYFQEVQEKIQKISQTGVVDDLMLLESELQIEGYIEDKIKASNPTDIPLIPYHLKKYASRKLDTWVKNAFHAKYYYHEHQQYRLITNDECEKIVAPVDYLNTGITMNNTVWSNGLHQFVQLKHNLHLTSESLTSSFISNIGYIKNYEDKNIFGMTGTLGSLAEQELLSEIYNVSYAKIPTFKTKVFEEYPMLVVEDEEWLDRIVVEVLKKINNERAVLVICETEEDLLDLRKKLYTVQKTARVYANEENVKETEEPVKSGDIILATNIAGRGTNFRTEEDLECKGGLHVCVGFLPCNLRVEDQAFGRTSRQGNKGSAQLVVRQSQVAQLKIEEVDPDDNEIKRMRNLAESKRLEGIKNVLVKELMFKDELFALFSKFYAAETKKKRNKWKKLVLEDLKEFWAFWLENRNFQVEEIARTTSKEEFDKFYQEAKDIIGGRVRQNPYHCLAIAEHHIRSNNRKEATEILHHAIEMNRDKDLNLLAGAYMKLFEIAVADGELIKNRIKEAIGKMFFISLKKNEEYKRNAGNYLQKAAEAIDKEIRHIEDCFVNETEDRFSEQVVDVSERENLLLKHMCSRLSCLRLHRGNIDTLLEEIRQSSELAIGGKSPTAEDRFEQEFTKSGLDEVITKHELHELQSIGIDTLFCLREVHDVAEPVVKSAQAQIGAGVAALSVGLVFLPSFPVMSQISGTLLSEGIMDITSEVLSQGHTEFRAMSYMKSKFISYGTALLTFGLTAALQSAFILDKAIEYCQKLSKFLRECNRFKKLCEVLLKVVDKIQRYFEKLRLAAELKNLTRFEQLEKLKDMKVNNLKDFVRLGCESELQKLEELQRLGKMQVTRRELLVDFAIKNRLAISKNVFPQVIKPLENQFFDKLFQEIFERVKSSIDNNSDLKKKLRTTKSDIDKAVDTLINSNHFKVALRSISSPLLSKLRYVRTVNLLSSAIELTINLAMFGNYATTFTSDLENALQPGKASNNVDKIVQAVCTTIATEMVEVLKQCYYKTKNIVSDARKMKFTKEWVIKDGVSHLPALGSALLEGIYSNIKHRLRIEMKTSLDESIRNCPGLLEKLLTSSIEEIFAEVDRFQHDHAMTEFKIAFEVLNSLEVTQVGRIASSGFSVTICSYKLVKCSKKFAAHLEQVLKGGDQTNKVDEIVEEICSKMINFLFPLLEQVITGTINIVSSVRSLKDFRLENISDNLPTISTNMLNVLLNQFSAKFVHILTKFLVYGFKNRSSLMEKLRTTPKDEVTNQVNQLISNDTTKILQVLFELFTTLETVSKTKLLTGSLQTIFNLSGLSAYIVHFAVSLENNLHSGNENNNADEIVESICAKLMRSIEPLLNQFFFQKNHGNLKNETFSVKLSKLIDFLWNWLRPKVQQAFRKNLRRCIRRRPLLMEKLRTTYRNSLKNKLHSILKKNLLERLLTKLVPELLVFLQKDLGKSGTAVLTYSFDITVHFKDLMEYQDSFAKELEASLHGGSHDNTVDVIIAEIEFEMTKVVTPILDDIYNNTKKIISVVDEINFADFDKTPIDSKKITSILINEIGESIIDQLVAVFENSLRHKLHESQSLKEKLCSNSSDYITSTIHSVVLIEKSKILTFLRELFETLQNSVQDFQMLFATVRAGLDLSQFVFYTKAFVDDLEECLQDGDANNDIEDMIDDVCITMTKLIRPLMKEILSSGTSFALQENKSLKSLPDVLETTKKFLWKKIYCQIIEEFKRHLDTSIRRRTSLMTKLQTTKRKFIVDAVRKILRKSYIETLITQLVPQFLKLIEHALTKSVAIILASSFNISIDLNELFGYLNDFVTQLDDMLRGRDSNNNVDDIIIEIEFNLVTKVSPLLENIYQQVTHFESAVLGKAEDLNDIFATSNTTAEVVIKEICIFIVDQTVEMIHQTFKNSLQQNASLEDKLCRTSTKNIDLALAEILNGDEIRTPVHDLVAENLQKLDSWLDKSVTNLVSEWIATMEKIIPLIHSLASKLEQNLHGGDENNDLDEVVEEICLDVANTIHDRLGETCRINTLDNMDKVKKMFVEELKNGLFCLKPNLNVRSRCYK